jgi:hypothetical protein
LLKQKDSALILKLSFKTKKTISEKISDAFGAASTQVLDKVITNLQEVKW